MNIRFTNCLAAFGVLVLAASSALADGVIRDSNEAITDGRGGTNIAFSDNGAVILSNPAGILNAEGTGLFEVSGDTLITDLHYSNPINDDASAKIRPLELPSLSYFQKSENGNWAWGIGIFAPAGFAAGWDLNNPVLGNQSYKSFGSLIKILPAVAWRPMDKLTIGATFGISYSYEELETPFFIQQGPFAAPRPASSSWATVSPRPGRSALNINSPRPRCSVPPTPAPITSASTATWMRLSMAWRPRRSAATSIR